ncbi:heavy metal translocating P-type ATPase [Corynebacterium caspium]|uniref:heavy metal translocating P-type ATPase n=1 Tax=Corynebacterium caspium TaxID=234828 RepID=UPI000381FE8D|nr:HAD family hydrolase [Corynebacterium caspium]WKD59901.1 Copper-exporting P-type ATPase A [Corynebacterium caspium DSM 44850]
MDWGEITLDPKTSFVFDIEGLTDAPQIAVVEASLRKIPGLQARVVYSPPKAWITAPENTTAEEIQDIFADHNLRATLTQSAALRYAVAGGPGVDQHIDGEDSVEVQDAAARRRHLMRWHQRNLRSPLTQLSATKENAANELRNAGYLYRAPVESLTTFDALYTARSLVTLGRVIVAILLTVPVLLLTYVESLQFYGWQWVIMVLTTPVATWCAWPFHRAFVGGVRRGVAALDGASSIAIISAYLWSIGTLLFTPARDPEWRGAPIWMGVTHDGWEFFFDVACGITTLLLIGRMISFQTRTSLPAELAAEQVDPGTVVTVGNKKVPVTEINPGDDVSVQPGERIPVDGHVVGGSAHIKPSVIEPHGVRGVKVDDLVFAGALVLDQPLKIRAEMTGHRTQASSVDRWVRLIQQRQRNALSDTTRTAGRFIPLAFGLAIFGAFMWYLATRQVVASFAVYLSVLAVIAPTSYALSMALPLRLGIDAAARRGVLLREGWKFRDLTEVDTVIFNRVGTLVDSAMKVQKVTPAPGEDENLVLRVAAALCADSDHPVSKAIVQAARASRDREAGARWIDVSQATVSDDGTFSGNIELPGTSRVITASVWRPRYVSDIMGPLARAAISANSPLVVRWDGQDRGVISMSDQMKPDAAAAVEALEDMGLDTIMLSRDMYPVARRCADRLGISRLLAGISAGRKAATVRGIHTRGATTALVGDSSLNDVLGVADVGILITDTVPVIRRDKEEHYGIDVVVLRSDVSVIPELFALSRRVVKVISRNYWFMASYSVVSIVMALAGWLHPMMATLLMLATSLIVELDSNSVRRTRP